MAERVAFKTRAEEAAALIQALIDSGVQPELIAGSASVSTRTVYRWWKEGRAPHPLMLEGLRKLAQKKGIL